MKVADASFVEAWTLTQRYVEAPERANMLGQFRHSCCESGFRKAACEHNLEVFTRDTKPAGGRYSLIKGGETYLVRSSIQRHCGLPRGTAFRRQWAAINRWLDPLQLDLLHEVAPPTSDRLCGMLVIASHPRRGDPSIPAYVGLGIPNAALTNWVRLIAITDLLGLYHDADAVARTPREAPIEVKDRAIPRLKERPRRITT